MDKTLIKRVFKIIFLNVNVSDMSEISKGYYLVVLLEGDCALSMAKLTSLIWHTPCSSIK